MSEEPRHPLLLVMSGGGQGRVVLDACLAAGYTVGAILDDTGVREHRGIEVVGTPEEWAAHAAGRRLVFAMGDGRRRLALGRAALEADATLETVVHPRAYISPAARLGRGVAVMAGATVHPEASIGDLCIVNANASLDHDVRLGDGVQIGPGVTFPGGVVCLEGVFVGAGVVALPGVTIGRGAVVGAGAVVTKDVPDGAIVAGNPARELERE